MARGSLSPPPSGHPRVRARRSDPEGDGERAGVRGSKELRPVNGLREARAHCVRLLVEGARLRLPLTLALSPQAGRGDPGCPYCGVTPVTTVYSSARGTIFSPLRVAQTLSW